MRAHLLGCLVVIFCLFTTLNAEVVFSDDFDTDLSQWSVATTGVAAVTLEADTVGFYCQVFSGNDDASIASNASFLGEGVYTMSFRLYHDIRDNNDGVRGGVAIPGGFSLAYAGWGNGYIASYKGVVVSSSIGGGEWATWGDFVITQDGRDVTVTRNGSEIYAAEMPTMPDYYTYSTVKVSCRADHAGANVRVDDLSLDFVSDQPMPTLVFSDDFDTDLSQWSAVTTGVGAVTLEADTVGYYCQLFSGADFAVITSNDSFLGEGAYTMSFRLYHDIRDNNDGVRGSVAIPGGFSLAYAGWGNGYIASYKGAVISSSVGGGEWAAWGDFVITQDGRDVTVTRNSTEIYAAEMPTMPDYYTYPKVVVSCRADHSGANVRVDDLSLYFASDQSLPTVLFSDDFNTDLSQWVEAVTGAATITLEDNTGGKYVKLLSGYDSALITSVESFSGEGKFTLTFDLYHDSRDYNDGRAGFVQMPGGLRMAWNGWANGYRIYYKDVYVGNAGGAGWANWAPYVMEQDGLNVSISRAGTEIFNATVPGLPDYNAYPNIAFRSGYDHASTNARVDNAQLVFTQAPPVNEQYVLLDDFDDPCDLADPCNPTMENWIVDAYNGGFVLQGTPDNDPNNPDKVVSFFIDHETADPCDHAADIISKDSFSAPGKYVLRFELFRDLRWYNDGESAQVIMPGGFTIGFNAWNNGMILFNQGQQIGSVATAGGNTWAFYEIIQDGGWVRVMESGTVRANILLATNPDYATYPNVVFRFVGDYEESVMKVNNLSMEFDSENAIGSDINDDGIVDLYDFSELAENYNLANPTADPNEINPDLNADGSVDVMDAVMLSQQWLNTGTRD